MSDKLVPLQPLMPAIQGQAPIRWLGRSVVAASHWRVVGEFPNISKAVCIAAPHSSIWDGVWGLSAAYAMGVRATWMGKDGLFRGPFGAVMRAIGGIPTDRKHSNGAVGQMIELLHERERLWLFLAPEGTRRSVGKWRTGFWHIARGAGVPIIPFAFDWEERCARILPPFETSNDCEADLQALYRLYAPYVGKGGKRAVPL